jgi:FdhE protein
MQDQMTQKLLAGFYEELNQVPVPKGAVVFSLPTPEELIKGREKAVPLLELCPPAVNPADFFMVLNRVAGVVQQHQPGLDAEIEQIKTVLPVKPENRKAFVARVFTPGAELLSLFDAEVVPEAFGLLLRYTAKLFMRQYTEKMAYYYDLERWQKGVCPVCGGRPGMALLGKEYGQRYLYCGLCEVRWRFRRLGCPYCANEHSQFITVEGMEMYRIYYCEQCRGYLKTVDEKSTGGEKIDLFWEDINTVCLDLLAMREGYHNYRPDPDLTNN